MLKLKLLKIIIILKALLKQMISRKINKIKISILTLIKISAVKKIPFSHRKRTLYIINSILHFIKINLVHSKVKNNTKHTLDILLIENQNRIIN